MRRRGAINKAVLAFVGLSLGATAVTTMGVTRLINGMQSQLEEAKVTTEPVDVVVALTMLAQGKPIAVEDLAMMTITTDFLPEHAVTDPENVVGRVARTRILPYETIRTARLAEATAGGGLDAISR